MTIESVLTTECEITAGEPGEHRPPDAVTHIEEGGLRIAEAVRALADLAPPTRPPAPLSRAGVEELLAPARAAGLPVTAEVEGEPAAELG